MTISAWFTQTKLEMSNIVESKELNYLVKIGKLNEKMDFYILMSNTDKNI